MQENKQKYVVKAWEKMQMKNDGNKEPKFFIEIENGENVKGVAPIVKFTIQSDPIGEVGVNGCQALDMLEYTKCLFESLNEAYHSTFNDSTIQALTAAIAFQEARTQDRLLRQVEGTNQK